MGLGDFKCSFDFLSCMLPSSMNNQPEQVNVDLVNEDESMETCRTKRIKISDSEQNSTEPKKEPDSCISTNWSTRFSLPRLDEARASPCSAEAIGHETSSNDGKDCFPGCSEIGCSGLEQENMGRKSTMEIEKLENNEKSSDNLSVVGNAGENCEASPSFNVNLEYLNYTSEEMTKQSRNSSEEEKASDDASMMRHPVDNLGQHVEPEMEDTSHPELELDGIKESMAPLGNKEEPSPQIMRSSTGPSSSLFEFDVKENVRVEKEEGQSPLVMSSLVDTSQSLSQLDSIKNCVAPVENKEDQSPLVMSSLVDTSQSLSQLDPIKNCVAPVENKEDQLPSILNSCTDTNHSLSEVDHSKGNNPPVCNKEDKSAHILRSCMESGSYHLKKKLLVLDVNGLLADIVAEPHEAFRPDTIIGGKAVFKRRHCDEFLKFCFEKFNVGVWTSRTRRNIERALDFLMRDAQKNLLFCWDQSQCTDTGFNTLENRDKPLLLKELRKLWEKQDPSLPWERGDYDESNTLLLDDSPYKALCNPPHTAIFPYSYRYRNTRDNFLEAGGAFRDYLERLAAADNVQEFVKQNPFGQRPITERNLSWKFFLRVIDATMSRREVDATGSSLAESQVEVNCDWSSKSVTDGASDN